MWLPNDYLGIERLTANSKTQNRIPLLFDIRAGTLSIGALSLPLM
jgi:hypothetical protein